MSHQFCLVAKMKQTNTKSVDFIWINTELLEYLPLMIITKNKKVLFAEAIYGTGYIVLRLKRIFFFLWTLIQLILPFSGDGCAELDPTLTLGKKRTSACNRRQSIIVSSTIVPIFTVTEWELNICCLHQSQAGNALAWIIHLNLENKYCNDLAK